MNNNLTVVKITRMKKINTESLYFNNIQVTQFIQSPIKIHFSPE